MAASALEGRRLLAHPFYQRWTEGRLSPIELTRYAEQYRFFEAYLPESLSHLVDELGDGVAHEVVLANLNDEIPEPRHLRLFEQFATAYGAQDVAALPAATSLLEPYRTAASSEDEIKPGVDLVAGAWWDFLGESESLALV